MSVRPLRPPSTSLDVVAGWLTDAPEHGPERAPEQAPEQVRIEGHAEVTGLTLSSQRVEPGDLYAALPGSRVHGIEFAADAVAAGAVAVLTDPDGARSDQLPDGVALLVVERPREVLGRVAAGVYGNPAISMRMVGITGTQGKTTTTRLLEAGLQGAGTRAAVIGTVGTRIAGRDVATTLTTPEAPDLHGLFALMRERGVAACAMEVSSHALVMGRVDAIEFDVAVFLNLGRDHLDFHDGVEDYYRAKASLFVPGRAARALVNLDDAHGRRLAGEVQVPLTTFALHHEAAHWRAVDVRLEREGSRFTVVGPNDVEVAAGVPLPGEFNVSNTLAAIAAAAEAGFDPTPVAAAIAASSGVPGRLERVECGQDFLVVVDYAHKPDAVQAAIGTLRPLAEETGGRVLVVLGAGGDRDPGKRPIMAGIAADLADLLVITDDNPRTEEPAAIRAAMLAGARGRRAEVLEVGDRRVAIQQVLTAARPGDVVLVAGKGHETGQEIAGMVHPFDDRDVARTILTRRGDAHS